MLPNTLSSSCRELLVGLIKKDARWRPSLREVFYHTWFRASSLSEVPNLLLQPGLPTNNQHRLSGSSSNCRTLNFTDIPEVESRRVSGTSQRSRRESSKSGKSSNEYQMDASYTGSHPSASTSGASSLPSIESAVAQMPPPAPRSSSHDASRSSSVETNDAVVRLPDTRLSITPEVTVSIPQEGVDKMSSGSDTVATPTPHFFDDGSECADEPDVPSVNDADFEDAITFLGGPPKQQDVPVDVPENTVPTEP